MIKRLFTVLVALNALAATAQVSLNTTLLGHLPYTEQLSALRGIEHNGREYAIVGIETGLSLVDVTDPANPTEVFFHPGPQSIWREPFAYNGHAYTVSEGGEGLQMIDMGPLPGSNVLTTGNYYGSTYPFTTGHTMFIDENGIAYIFGSDYGVGGAIFLDLSDPMNPVELGVWDQYYIHDGHVRNDTLWAACIQDGLAVMVDVSDKQNPQVITSWQTPSAFTHNIWPSTDGHYAFTTDEVTGAYYTAYDLTDLQNVVEVDRINNVITQDVIPHNTHYINGFLVNSNYRDGMTILDVSDPTNMVLTGYYDTSTLTGDGFNGVWEAWPYLPSGNILAGDMENGLYIIGATYTQACRVEGTVTDISNSNPLANATATIVGTSATGSTNIFGNYSTGTATGGTYDVLFQKPGYEDLTIANVVLTNGQTLTLDAALTPIFNYTQTFTVVDILNLVPIAGAQVRVQNAQFEFNGTTDANGQVSFNPFYEGDYEVLFAHWGHLEDCTSLSILATSGDQELHMIPGYSDHFNFDLGWTVTSTSPTGHWERGIPVGTFNNGEASNPGADVNNDCGNYAYVTGNGGGNAGDDDVDDGEVVLTSPYFQIEPSPYLEIHLSTWFYNAGGSGSPNDVMEVQFNLGNGWQSQAPIGISVGQWSDQQFWIQPPFPDSIQLRVRIEDLTPGHLVEGGIDRFNVIYGSGVVEVGVRPFTIAPNPITPGILALNVASGKAPVLSVTDLAGRTLLSGKKLNVGQNHVAIDLPPGMYLASVLTEGRVAVQRFVVSQ